jgi:hypothetical protein
MACFFICLAKVWEKCRKLDGENRVLVFISIYTDSSRRSDAETRFAYPASLYGAFCLVKP